MIRAKGSKDQELVRKRDLVEASKNVLGKIQTAPNQME